MTTQLMDTELAELTAIKDRFRSRLRVVSEAARVFYASTPDLPADETGEEISEYKAEEEAAAAEYEIEIHELIKKIEARASPNEGSR